MTNFVATPSVPAPDIVRCAYMEIVVTDLARSREFYVDVLGLHVTEEDENAIYLRPLEEFIHHNLVLRKGPIAAVAAFAYRVKSPAEVDAAEAYYKELGCRTERRIGGFTKGVGDSVRVEDPLGFPYEFFYDVEHVERLTQRYDLYSAGELVRLDHFNQVTPTSPAAAPTSRTWDSASPRTSRIPTASRTPRGCTASRPCTTPPSPEATARGCTTSRSPRTRSTTSSRSATRWAPCASATGSNAAPAGTAYPTAFYLYILDPDGHRIEIYTQDYYTGDPDNPTITWDVHDNQRRDWWGNPVVPSWYTEASLVLDLDGNPQPVIVREEKSEMAVTVGADGFSYTRKQEGADAEAQGFKLGAQL
jgi:catechol 2,3-dioxygenase